jgi:hypothetical protein
MIANALPRPLTAGSVDNAILRADGTDGTILQTSGINIDDSTVSTQSNVAITNQHSGQTNSSIVLTPKGTGALIAGPKPDGTAVGGNARGSKAICLVGDRSAATQVASGADSVAIGRRATAVGANAISISGNASGANNCIAIGSSSTASGNQSIAIGTDSSVTASGDRAVCIGGQFTTASGTGSVAVIGGGAQAAVSAQYAGVFAGHAAVADRIGMNAHAVGAFAVNGDVQRARFVLRRKTTNNTATELLLDSSTRLTIPSGKVVAMTINIAGVSSTGAAVAHYIRQYALKNVAGTTSQVYAPVTIGTDNAAGTSISLSANDTNDALNVSVTGIAAETWRWVASVDAVEIAYGT